MDPNQSTQDPKEAAKQKKKEMQEAAMDMMFGKNRHEYAGNIWGWKFSILSLIGLLLVASFMAIGIATGNINLDKQVEDAKAAKAAKEAKLYKQQDSINAD